MENYKPARWLRIVMIFAGLAALAIAGAYFLLRGYSHDWNIFFMHPSPEGHHLLATYLEQALAEHGWLNPKG